MSFDSINRKIGGKLNKSGGKIAGDLSVASNLEVSGDLQVSGINIISQLIPVGTILTYAGSSAPSSIFLLCDGSAISRTQYSQLFSAIGTTYGSGDGSTTFNIPNTSGLFLRGAGSQAISGITYSATLGTSQGDQIQGHFHGTVGTNGATLSPGAQSIARIGLGEGANNSAVRNASSDGINGTPRTGSETRPANISVNYIIRCL